MGLISMLGNWKTTAAGVGAVMLAAGSFLSGDSSISMEQLAALAAGLGLIAGKDASTGSSPSD